MSMQMGKTTSGVKSMGPALREYADGSMIGSTGLNRLLHDLELEAQQDQQEAPNTVVRQAEAAERVRKEKVHRIKNALFPHQTAAPLDTVGTYLIEQNGHSCPLLSPAEMEALLRRARLARSPRATNGSANGDAQPARPNGGASFANGHAKISQQAHTAPAAARYSAAQDDKRRSDRPVQPSLAANGSIRDNLPAPLAEAQEEGARRSQRHLQPGSQYNGGTSRDTSPAPAAEDITRRSQKHLQPGSLHKGATSRDLSPASPGEENPIRASQARQSSASRQGKSPSRTASPSMGTSSRRTRTPVSGEQMEPRSTAPAPSMQANSSRMPSSRRDGAVDSPQPQRSITPSRGTARVEPQPRSTTPQRAAEDRSSGYPTSPSPQFLDSNGYKGTVLGSGDTRTTVAYERAFEQQRKERRDRAEEEALQREELRRQKALLEAQRQAEEDAKVAAEEARKKRMAQWEVEKAEGQKRLEQERAEREAREQKEKEEWMKKHQEEKQAHRRRIATGQGIAKEAHELYTRARQLAEEMDKINIKAWNLRKRVPEELDMSKKDSNQLSQSLGDLANGAKTVQTHAASTFTEASENEVLRLQSATSY